MLHRHRADGRRRLVIGGLLAAGIVAGGIALAPLGFADVDSRAGEVVDQTPPESDDESALNLAAPTGEPSGEAVGEVDGATESNALSTSQAEIDEFLLALGPLPQADDSANASGEDANGGDASADAEGAGESADSGDSADSEASDSNADGSDIDEGDLGDSESSEDAGTDDSADQSDSGSTEDSTSDDGTSDIDEGDLGDSESSDNESGDSATGDSSSDVGDTSEDGTIDENAIDDSTSDSATDDGTIDDSDLGDGATAFGSGKAGRAGIFTNINVQRVGQPTLVGSDKIVAAVGCENCPALIKENRGITVSVTASVGLEAKVIKAGLDLTVGEVYNIDVTCGPTQPLKPGQRLVAFANYLKHDFKVFNGPTLINSDAKVIGEGSVFEPKGVDCRIV